MGLKCEQINLGDLAKDDVTNFQGVVVAVTRWLHGCDRIAIQPRELDKDQKLRDAITFDRLQCSLITKSVVEVTSRAPTEPPPTGGPTPNAVSRPSIER